MNKEDKPMIYITYDESSIELILEMIGIGPKGLKCFCCDKYLPPKKISGIFRGKDGSDNVTCDDIFCLLHMPEEKI